MRVEGGQDSRARGNSDLKVWGPQSGDKRVLACFEVKGEWQLDLKPDKTFVEQWLKDPRVRHSLKQVRFGLGGIYGCGCGRHLVPTPVHSEPRGSWWIIQAVLAGRGAVWLGCDGSGVGG